MNALVAAFERDVLILVWIGVALAIALTLAIVVERLVLAYDDARTERLRQRYEPLISRALDGDADARAAIMASPSRHRLPIARMLITPLIADRDPKRIAAARQVVGGLSLAPITERLLRSVFWWHRVLALRAVGLLQASHRGAQVVAALDDRNPQVRNAALDALADMQNPAALPAVVVRVNDTSLHRGRRAAAIAAYAPQCEPFLLDLAHADAANRFTYTRALLFCGTDASRATLCEWTADPRAEVRAGAFEALAHVGVDENAARLAMTALESDVVAVRAMAAAALHGWNADGAAPRLARHLDDAWPVAVHAARSLRSMKDTGRIELEARAARTDLAGTLARQMLWEAQGQW